MIPALEEPAGGRAGGGLGSSSGAKAGAPAATLALPTRRQPSAAPSPPTSGKGREQRQRTIPIVFHDFLQGSSSSAMLQPSHSGCSTTAPCARSCADAAGDSGDVVPVPRCLPPNPRSLVSTSTETALSAGLSRSPQLLSYSPAPPGVPETLRHGNMAVLG